MRTSFTLHDFQRNGTVLVRDFLKNARPDSRLAVASPTGTGKSIVELECQRPGEWLLTPRVEIIAGMLAKLGKNLIGFGEDAVVRAAWDEQITTPVRFRNALLRGEIDPEPTALHLDEGHHAEADTYTDLTNLCNCPQVCYTATPYRGTAKGTAEFRRKWGEPRWLIMYPEAIRRGFLSFPRCSVVPLVDDDTIEVVNGEFVVAAVSSTVQSRLGAVVAMCGRYVEEGLWDTPTMFAVPSTECALQLTELLVGSGCPAVCVTQATSHAARQSAFDSCLGRRASLVQIAVVSEGVDLAVRRLIDLSPSLSPVKWLQQFGRITRPGGLSEYICTNRNLLRHCYLLEGCLPPAILAEAQAAFGGAGKRAAARVLGLEALGRLKAAELPLSDGTTGLMYQFASANGSVVTEYAVLVHPLRAKPIWAKRNRTKASETSQATYGKWQRCVVPDGVEGFASASPSPVTKPQSDWWKRSAARHGLDPAAEITRKNFAALPVLADLHTRI
jgi:hypothetical protein